MLSINRLSLIIFETLRLFKGHLQRGIQGTFKLRERRLLIVQHEVHEGRVFEAFGAETEHPVPRIVVKLDVGHRATIPENGFAIMQCFT